MDRKRIRMKVMGLSIGQIRTGAYALILAQTDGPIRIPVIIGAPEAQAIASRMEHVTTPRPMTHDLFASMAHAFGIAIQEVFIYKFEDGVFLSEISMTDGERRISIDSRTSDAIAIAMRTGAPIYTTHEILEECGFVIKDEPVDSDADKNDSGHTTGRATRDLPVNTLEKLRDKAIQKEDYEEAARLTEIINNKKSTL